MRQLRPCLTCGRPTRFGPRCELHAQPELSARQHRAVRAQVLSEEATCWLCGEPARDGDPLTLDHVRSRVHGGATTRANGRAAHASCNARRGATTRGGSRNVGERAAGHPGPSKNVRTGFPSGQRTRTAGAS